MWGRGAVWVGIVEEEKRPDGSEDKETGSVQQSVQVLVL